MSANLPEPTSTESYWRAHLERQPLSGLSVREYCQREGFSQASFYNWRKRLHSSPAAPPAISASPIPFVELTSLLPRPSSHSPWQMEVALPNGITLRLASGFEPAALQQALEALTRC